MSRIADAKELIAKSGNNFHCKVVASLRANGWGVLVSPYYVDDMTDKAREIDIIAEKAFPRAPDSRKRPIHVKLFVECKFVPSENIAIFWTAEKDEIHARELDLKFSGENRPKVYSSERYANNSITAKLFATKSQSKSGNDNDMVYKAMNQCLSSMVALREGDSIISESGGSSQPSRLISLPVILFSNFDTFFRVEMEGEEEPEPVTENFMLEVNYAYRGADGKHFNEYFLIDVVDFKSIDTFLTSINTAVNTIRL